MRSMFLERFICISVLSINGLNLPAQTYSVIHSFSYGNAANPYGALTCGGNALYGVTAQFGDGASLFTMNPDGSGFEILSPQSCVPGPGVVVSGIMMFGTANLNPRSYLYKMYLGGSGFTLLNSGTNTPIPGAPPNALILSGDVFYGTTRSGGTSNAGTVFSITTNGTQAATLHNFGGSPDGAWPEAGLVLNNGVLYGTTYSGGSAGYGTVFAITTNGTGYSILYNFTNDFDGANPQSELLWCQGALYGTAGAGGSVGQGTVYKINTDGTGYTVLRSFTNTPDGANPQAGLTLVGTTFYGTTYYGGTAGLGTIFQMNIDGTGYTVIRSFLGHANGDGAGPSATLAICCGAMYGVTYSGGTNYEGTVFSLIPPPPPLQICSVSNVPVVFWQNDGFNRTLQTSTNLASHAWTSVSNGVPLLGVQVTNAVLQTNAFFRLQ